MEECRKLNGCPTGEAKITGGYQLPAKYVIHTVGPIWQGGQANEEELLRSCYRNCLNLAAEHNIKTIAFPSISTGVYHFPVNRAAEIAVSEIMEFLKKNDTIEKVLFVCHEMCIRDRAMEKIQEYPNCDKLICMIASVLEGGLIFFRVEEKENYQQQIDALYHRSVSYTHLDVYKRQMWLRVISWLRTAP